MSEKLIERKIKNILVVRTDRIGELLLNIPAIRALKENYNASVTILVSPETRELVESINEIDSIMEFDQQKWQKNVFSRIGLLGDLRKRHFDLAVVLNPTRRMHALTFFAGIPKRLGYKRKWGFFLTDTIEDKKDEGAKHEVEYNLDLVRSIGVESKNNDISLRVSKEDEKLVAQLLQNLGIKNEDELIAIEPNSANPAKCWPKEYFAQVIDQISTSFSVKVAIIGSAQERSAVIKLCFLTNHQPVNLCGELPLKQLPAFLKRSKLLISNDRLNRQEL